MKAQRLVFANHPQVRMIGNGEDVGDINSYQGPEPEFRTTYRFTPNDLEKEIMNSGGDIMVTFLTHGQPAPPIMVWAMKGTHPYTSEEAAKTIDGIAHTQFYPIRHHDDGTPLDKGEKS